MVGILVLPQKPLTLKGVISTKKLLNTIFKIQVTDNRLKIYRMVIDQLDSCLSSNILAVHQYLSTNHSPRQNSADNLKSFKAKHFNDKASDGLNIIVFDKYLEIFPEFIEHEQKINSDVAKLLLTAWHLIKARREIAELIGSYKQVHQLKIKDEQRWANALANKLTFFSTENIELSKIKKFWDQVHEVSCNIQQKIIENKP